MNFSFDSVLFGYVVSQFLVNALWAFGSLLWVEVVRDFFHVLSHRIVWLIRHHAWHHRVFSKDMSPVSRELYQASQWHHDVPEALVMLLFGALFFACAFHWSSASGAILGTLLGFFYAMRSVCITVCRGLGYDWAIALDHNHQSPKSVAPPSKWMINWSSHQRHHFENSTAYYSGVFAFVDKLLGTALSLKGKRVVVTGASGALGTELLKHFVRVGAKVTALTSSQDGPVVVQTDDGPQSMDTIVWKTGNEEALVSLLESSDILVLNHGVNKRNRSEEAVLSTFEINTLSTYRLLERFLDTVNTPFDASRKEAWVITSEAEVAPAYSPLYEMSKRTIGKLVTLKRLDAPCILRKVVIGAFQSRMSPNGRLSAGLVAKLVFWAVHRDTRNIVISPFRPWIYLLYPLNEWITARYYRKWSQDDSSIVH